VPIPAGDEVFAPPGATFYGEPPVDVSEIYLPTDDYFVQGANQTIRYPRSGRVIPTIMVSFEVPGLNGLHTLMVDNYAFTHADVLGYLRGRAARLRRMTALPERLPPDPEEV
jgi:hypothetical protein